MSIQFSSVIAARTQGRGSTFAVKQIDLHELGKRASPVAVLDDFRVTGRPFGPHPHAGFSPVTYVFEDSKGSLRARDSLGNDAVVGPGGVVWTQAGSGLMHEEIPADDRELHGLQIFVNVSAKNKLTPPRVQRLQGHQIPEWHNNAGDRLRVVVGEFKGLSSRITPAEPFNLFDVELRREITFPLPAGHNALLYVLRGEVLVRADPPGQSVTAEHAIALHGERGGDVVLQPVHSAELVILSGAEIDEPVHAEGPFIMNDASQVEDAFTRFRKGAMGRLTPAHGG